MIKLIDLDDLTSAIAAIVKELKALKLKKGGKYLIEINIYWPAQGIFHLDAGVLAAVVGKELAKSGLKGEEQMISCGLHQNDGRAGEIEIKAQVRANG